MLVSLKWLIVTCQLCCPTTACWIKRSQRLKMLCHSLPLPICLRCAVLYESQGSAQKEFSSHHCFHWLWVLHIVVKETCLLYRCCPSLRGPWVNSVVCSTVIDQSHFLDRDTERERREKCVFLTYSSDMDVCVFYLTVSQVSLQLGNFLPQLLQLLLAGLHLLSFFSLFPLSLLLQALNDPLLNTGKDEEEEEERMGEEVKK